MPRGGARPGAGRPKGAKNKATLLREAAVKFGIVPLDYLLSVMVDESQPDELRLAAAKAALPYCHSRLAAVRVVEDNGGMTHEDWCRQLEQELAHRPQAAWEEAPAL